MTKLNFVLDALLVLTGVISVTQSQNPYCSIRTCSPANSNTLCKYSINTWGSTCNSASAPGTGATEKTKILSLHNDSRRKVAKGLETRGNPGPQPPASNMRESVWDDELALMAQTHAQQCVFQHDSCRDVSRFNVGQNIYMEWSSVNNPTPDWTAVTSSWYNEVQNMPNSFVSKFPTQLRQRQLNAIGHYTQMVWANTYAIGCGVVSFQSSGMYSKFYVCNYGPAGNWLGSPIYTQGAAGSDCPAGTTNKDGLCA